MARPRRSNDWGFPRWRSYGETGSDAAAQQICDRDGCDLPGTCPAPKAPDRPERWWFCEAHAAEYNRGWNYFEALKEEESTAYQQEDARSRKGYARSGHWAWASDESAGRAEEDALELFGLEPGADAASIKSAYRRMAKANHPDLNPDDTEAADRFRAAQAAYDILRRRFDSVG